MRLLSVALLVPLAPGCLLAQGSFDEVSFQPVTTAFAIADRHDLVVRNGTVVATRRPEQDQRLTLVFTGAQVPVNEEWSQTPYRRLLDIRHDLAELDGLLVDDIPLEEVSAGATFSLEWEGPGLVDDGLAAAVVMRSDTALQGNAPALGSRFALTLEIVDANPRAEGFVSGNLTLERRRADGQDDDVAGGTVTIGFQMPVASERRGKANLAIARPILRCAGASGPTRAAGCHDEPAEPLLDATGLVAAGALDDAP